MKNQFEKPDGIIITMPEKFLIDLAKSCVGKNLCSHHTKKWLINLGFDIYQKQMETVIENENSYWIHKISAIPTIDVLYCYITCLGKILYRGNIGEFRPGGKLIFPDGRDCIAKHWMIITHPFVKASEEINKKGFQGFRYTKFLF